MTKVIALIVAGGSGSRFGANIPKQYTASILTRTIKAFLSSTLIDGIQVVIRPEDIELYNQAVKGLELLSPVFGGGSRGESVRNGLNEIEKYKPDLVLVHDANRPYLSVKLINEIINKLKLNPGYGVVPSMPIVDTVRRLNESGDELIKRDNLVTIQTPQGFYFQDLWSIYKYQESEFIKSEK